MEEDNDSAPTRPHLNSTLHMLINLVCFSLSNLGEVPARAEGVEGKPKYKSVDAALDDLEAALEKIIEEIG
jgi:hypothetical protein